MKLPIERVLVAFMGASGIAAAAFYAHGLEKLASAAQMRWWAIACAIQLVTVPALLALQLHHERTATARASWASRWSRRLFATGCLFFCGTLYAMALGGPRILGAVTPLGGLLLIAGWCLVAMRSPSP